MSKNIVSKEKEIALQKLIVGHFIENIPEDCKKKVCYVLQGDGLWERRTNRLGTFTTRMKEFKVPGLHSHLKEDWQLEVPRIPASILVQIVSFFRKINRTYDSEVFVQVFYDFEKNEYLAHVPKQVVSGASVNYRNDNELENNSNLLLVFEIHSHNTMGAFFSGVDDRDEKADRFYGVVGRLNNYYPEMLIRLSIGGQKIAIEIDELFDLDGDEAFAEIFPAEWMTKVSKQNFKVKNYRGGRKVYVPMKSPYGTQLMLTNPDEEEMAEVESDELDIHSHRGSLYNWQDETFKSNADEKWLDGLFDDVHADDTTNWRGKKF